jgi:hypothetical protein
MFITETEAATALGCDLIEIRKLVSENLLESKSDPHHGKLVRKRDVDGLAQVLAPATPTSKQPKLFDLKGT